MQINIIYLKRSLDERFDLKNVYITNTAKLRRFIHILFNKNYFKFFL